MVVGVEGVSATDAAAPMLKTKTVSFWPGIDGSATNGAAAVDATFSIGFGGTLEKCLHYWVLVVWASSANTAPFPSLQKSGRLI